MFIFLHLSLLPGSELQREIIYFFSTGKKWGWAKWSALSNLQVYSWLLSYRSTTDYFPSKHLQLTWRWKLGRKVLIYKRIITSKSHLQSFFQLRMYFLIITREPPNLLISYLAPCIVSKHSTHLIPRNDPMNQVFLYTLSEWGASDVERLSKLYKFTQLGSGRVQLWAYTICLQRGLTWWPGLKVKTKGQRNPWRI